jgi:competence protein ComEC
MPVPHPEVPLPSDYMALVVQLRLAGARIVHPPVGRVVSSGDARLTVLHPWHHRAVAAVDPTLGVNDNSLVVLFQWAGRSILFAGDLEAEGEDVLLRRVGPSLAVDLVKVGHHGSKTSSRAGFVNATHPALAVISCGRGNRFGFPDPGVVARWRRAGARVLRTDRLGTVVVEIDESGVLRVTPGGTARFRRPIPAPAR